MSKTTAPYHVRLTVHDLCLSSNIDGTFVFAWKCGSSGQTERQLCAAGIVTFDKFFEFSVRFHTDRSAVIKSKIVKLKIFRYTAGSTKARKFAVAEVDLLPYAMAGSALSSRLAMTSPHKCAPTLNVTIAVTPATADFTGPDTALSSSAVSGLTTDHKSSWDLSDSVATEEFQAFVGENQRRHAAMLQTLGLTARARPARKKGPHHKNEMGGEALSVFMGAGTSAADQKKAHRRQCREEVDRIVRLVPSIVWASGYVCQVTCPPAAAMYAAFAYTPFLKSDIKEREFVAAFEKFWEGFEKKTFVEHGFRTDFLLVAMYLIALLRQTSEAVVASRMEVVGERLKGFALEELKAEVEIKLADFKSLVPKIVVPDLEPNSAAFGISRTFHAIEARGNIPPHLHQLMIRHVLDHLDALLVEELLKHPELLSVTHAAQFRWLSTVLTLGDFAQPLVLFPEVLSVVMMSSAICTTSNPAAELRDICPHIPKQVVLFVLKNQVIDDFAPLLNDTTSFESTFASELEAPQPSLFPPIEPVLEQAIQGTDVSGWKNAVLPSDAFAVLPFLSGIFQPPEQKASL
jgi:hypothetical protein